MDLRDRTAFARGHVAGSFNVEAGAAFAARLALLLPAGRPVTLLAETPERIAAAQRELVRVGVDRPAAAATGDPRDWVRGGEALRAYPVGTFAGLAEALGRDPDGTVVLDVRHGAERAAGHIEGSAHVPCTRCAGVPPDSPPERCGCTAAPGRGRPSPRPCSTRPAGRSSPSTTPSGPRPAPACPSCAPPARG